MSYILQVFICQVFPANSKWSIAECAVEKVEFGFAQFEAATAKRVLVTPLTEGWILWKE